MRQVDKDGSGEIGFKEFLAILQPTGGGAGKSAIDKIVHLQDVKKVRLTGEINFWFGFDEVQQPATSYICTCVALDLQYNCNPTNVKKERLP